MSESSYRDAVRTLREQASPADDGGTATRRRLQASLVGRPAALRRRKVGLVLSLAAALSASTALAFYAASREAARELVRHTTMEELPRPESHAPEVVLPSRRMTSNSALEEPSLPPSIALAPAPAARQRTRSIRRSAGNVATERSRDAGAQTIATSPAPQLSPLSATERDGLYLTAHRLHFRSAPAVALAAWDAFLASEPTGGRALEARYNRGVVLLRLGRVEDARSALLPFANGEHAGFRREEALRLLTSPGSQR